MVNSMAEKTCVYVKTLLCHTGKDAFVTFAETCLYVCLTHIFLSLFDPFNPGLRDSFFTCHKCTGVDALSGVTITHTSVCKAMMSRHDHIAESENEEASLCV